MKFALAGFGREVGGNVVDMIGERAAMNGAGPAETYVALGGRPLDLNSPWLRRRRRWRHASGWFSSAMELLGVNLGQPGRPGLGGGAGHRLVVGIPEL